MYQILFIMGRYYPLHVYCETKLSLIVFLGNIFDNRFALARYFFRFLKSNFPVLVFILEAGLC